jgi:hypothetical protein
MIPKRRKAQPLGLRQAPQLRSDAHLRWIRGHNCSCMGSGGCDGKIEAAHVRSGTDGGMGVKPSDRYAIPLCGGHHREQHQIGEAPFEARHKISMRKIADALWAKSPHRATAEARR